MKMEPQLSYFGIPKVTPQQSRMARGALKIGVRELARLAKCSVSTVVRFEAGEELKERTVDSLQTALERAGVEFIGRRGVKLREPK
jgi:transcriptional regulator with XRE-family HTH domain